MLEANEKFTVSKPTAYSFRFKGYSCSWAIFTINESTGEFLITSDMGNFSHRWNMGAIAGGNLTEFIGNNTNTNYLVGKLKVGSNSSLLEDHIDEEETKKTIIEYAKDSEYSKEYLDELLDELGWVEDFSEAGLLRDGHEAVLNILTGDSDLVCYEHSPDYKFLRDELLPFFCGWLRANILTKEAENVSP